ncbi:MAG: DUF5660 family protein [Patescibacteria group bacterium]|nr:DUF5660 family protein [Patescibacteria group bacterium]
MNSFGSKATRSKQSSQSKNQSLARAMAETEKRRVGQRVDQNFRTNKQSKLKETPLKPNQTAKFQADQLKQKEQEFKKRQLRERLHKKVNPVEQTDIFNQRKENVKREIEQIRIELEKLSKEIAKFHKEVDITLQKRTPDPGMEGTYYKNFFEKLKAFIILLRQRVRSARTWVRQAQIKKKKRKYRRGLDFGGNEAKASHDMLHHERYNAYSGA